VIDPSAVNYCRIAAPGHRLEVADEVAVAGVTGIAGVNGTWRVTATAQDYGYSGPTHYDEGVTVYAPRHFDRDAATGAPIERVAASRVVNYSDIDPNTRWGDHVLRGTPGTRTGISAARSR